jgi:hypothetical protein
MIIRFSLAPVLGAVVGLTGQTTAMPFCMPVVPIQAAPEPGTIDMAICLDTSGSMSGLIDAAKQKLWAIVNELAAARPTPKLRVALLTFGNNGHDPEDGWVRIESGLTEDLDLISQKLFALTTNGGTEYVGRVLQYADQLAWHPSDKALKLVVVAGNESADQDREVPFRVMCKSLVSRGIMIDSIYCGPTTDDIAPAWMEVAKLADGQFSAIDHEQGTLVIASPYDDQLAVLSAALNETYIPFGAAGARGYANQSAQDANAAGLNSAAAASRARTKSQGLYHCSWDLVDACTSGQVVLADVPVKDLPDSMQAMTAEGRSAYVQMRIDQRAEIKRQIAELSARRKAFVQEEITRQSLDASKSFDDAIRRAVRDKATGKGFSFDVMPDDGC